MSNPWLNTAYSVVVGLHIAAGTIALIAFWTAGLARKRAAGLHVRSGTIYLAAMRAILVTAVPMAAMAFVRGKPVAGTFLSYLVVLVGSTVYIAPRAVRNKRDFEAYRSGGFRFFAWALPIAALGTFAMGIVSDAPLLWGFSIVGMVAGAGMQRTMRRATPEPGWWLRQHYTAMIGNGIGTHIAFLSIGLSHLIPGGYPGSAYLPWFGPVIVGLAVRTILDRRHDRRFMTARRANVVVQPARTVATGPAAS
jgi:hypothetical protein